MKKNNLSKIMKRAWEIKKENCKNIFSICLKIAWEESRISSNPKSVIEQMLKKEVSTDVPEGYFYKWTKNEWVNYGKNRTYYEIKEFSDGSQRRTIYCGYIDNVTGEYVKCDKKHVHKYDAISKKYY